MALIESCHLEKLQIYKIPTKYPALVIPDTPASKRRKERRNCLVRPVLSESISLFGNYYFYYYDNTDHKSFFFYPS